MTRARPLCSCEPSFSSCAPSRSNPGGIIASGFWPTGLYTTVNDGASRATEGASLRPNGTLAMHTWAGGRRLDIRLQQHGVQSRANAHAPGARRRVRPWVRGRRRLSRPRGKQSAGVCSVPCGPHIPSTVTDKHIVLANHRFSTTLLVFQRRAEIDPVTSTRIGTPSIVEGNRIPGAGAIRRFTLTA